MPALVLASASPRRRELLALLGVPFDIVATNVDERAAVSPAIAKADAAGRRGIVVLAADTEIDDGSERLGKPADEPGAIAMLTRLSGREHEVVTEVATIDAAGRTLAFAVRSKVRLRPRDDRAIAEYVATGEPADKAGSYAIQGRGGALVESADGCLANIVGLPLCHTAGALRRAGIVFTERAAPACQRHFGFRCPVWERATAESRALRESTSYATFTGRNVLESEVRILRGDTRT